MTNDNIIREIDEELRSDRVRSLWRRFGPYVIGAAVLVVLAVAINEGWSWWQGSNSARSSDQFYAALELANGTDVPAAQKALDDVIAAGHGGYPVLARFREAGLLAQQGKNAEAAAAYDAIATGEQNTHLRGLALLLAGYALVDSGDVAQVQQRVAGLDEPTDPLRNAAREALGLVKYKAGDLDGAKASFEEVLADGMASQETRSRLAIYIAQLISEGATVDAAADAAAAGDVPAQAAPAAPAAEPPANSSVGDAPELDTTPPSDAAPAADAPAMEAPAMEAVPMMDAAPATEAPAAPATPAPAEATPVPAAPAN